LPAGRLLDELGLKGARVGDAMVSDVHANFFVNMGQARAADILELIEQVRTRARELRGIELETEVEIVGEDA
jgi:UDP-N-acetylmuramate dehydrogenase